MTKLWTEKQVGEYLGLTTRTIRQYRFDGTGPKFMKSPGIKGAVRYRPSDVEEWVKERIATSTSFATQHLGTH